MIAIQRGKNSENGVIKLMINWKQDSIAGIVFGIFKLLKKGKVFVSSGILWRSYYKLSIAQTDKPNLKV